MKNRIINFRRIEEYDGNLVFFEGKKEIPFEIKRVFYINGVPQGMVRANHASLDAEFVLIAINGSVRVSLDDGTKIESFLLEDNNVGLHVETMLWMKTWDFSENAILMVVSDKEYEDCHYLNDYSEFQNKIRKINL